MRRTLVIALVLLAVAGAYLLTGDGDEARPLLRPAITMPEPDLDAKVRYFYAAFTSGQQTEVAGDRIPTWHRIAEPALLGLERPALDFLLSPERYAEYRASPNILSNVLQVLAKHDVKSHPRLHPFLLHWLDPENCPPVSQGNDWVNHWRKPIFALFTHMPDPRQVPACLDELDNRRDRKQDLRKAALIVLLRLKEVDVIEQRWSRFEKDIVVTLLLRFYELAQVDPPTARAFDGRMRAALASGAIRERIYAAAGLLRLGDTTMADLLWTEYERAIELGNEDAAWSALRFLAAESQDERVLAVCLKHAQGGTPSFAWTIANELLRKYWPSHQKVVDLLWVRFDTMDPAKPLDNLLLLALMKLGRTERDRVVAFLKTCMLGDNRVWRDSAIRFAQVKRVVPEAGAWIVKLLQTESDPVTRAKYYAALVSLRNDEMLALARVDLTDASSMQLRQSVTAILIALEDEQGLATIAKQLRDGNKLPLEVIFRTSQNLAGGGLPDGLVPAMLDALATLSGEEDRLKALFILRARGRLDDIEERLIQIYRTEPSRRVARQIGTVLEELAHR